MKFPNDTPVKVIANKVDNPEWDSLIGETGIVLSYHGPAIDDLDLPYEVYMNNPVNGRRVFGFKEDELDFA